MYDERLTTAVGLLRGPRVLHLGAAGNFAPTADRHFAQQALVDAGFSVLATDLSPSGVAWLQERGFEAEQMDAERIPAEGEPFDGIFAGELIEHLSNPGLFLDGCRRRLREGGRLVITTPQPFNPLHIGMYALRKDPFLYEHVAWYDAQLLRQLLERHGFRLVELEFVNDSRPEGWSRRFRNTRRLLAAAPGKFKTAIVAAAEPSKSS